MQHIIIYEICMFLEPCSLHRDESDKVKYRLTLGEGLESEGEGQPESPEEFMKEWTG